MEAQKRDTISQGELAALMEEREAAVKAVEQCKSRTAEVLARVKAGARVQRGYYRIMERFVLDHSWGLDIYEGTPRCGGGLERFVEPRAKRAAPKKAKS